MAWRGSWGREMRWRVFCWSQQRISFSNCETVFWAWYCVRWLHNLLQRRGFQSIRPQLAQTWGRQLLCHFQEPPSFSNCCMIRVRAGLERKYDPLRWISQRCVCFFKIVLTRQKYLTGIQNLNSDSWNPCPFIFCCLNTARQSWTRHHTEGKIPRKQGSCCGFPLLSSSGSSGQSLYASFLRRRKQPSCCFFVNLLMNRLWRNWERSTLGSGMSHPSSAESRKTYAKSAPGCSSCGFILVAGSHAKAPRCDFQEIWADYAVTETGRLVWWACFECTRSWVQAPGSQGGTNFCLKLASRSQSM